MTMTLDIPANRLTVKAVGRRYDRIRARIEAGIDELSDGINAGILSPVEWHNAMVELLRVGYTAAYMDGRGVTTLTPGAERQIARMVAGQVEYLNKFLDQIEADGWSEAMRSRALMYGASTRQAAERGGTFGLDLPQVPGDGRTRCVATSHSRVLTGRGLIPICEVRVGDEVYTHKHRWRRVTAVHMHRSEGQSIAYVQGLYGAPVGFTTDHKLYTPDGWVPVEGIDAEQLSVYNIPILLKGDGDADNLSDLWSEQGSTVAGVQIVWHGPQSQGAVGEPSDAPEDGTSFTGGQWPSSASVGRYFRQHQVEHQGGWPEVYALLGGKYQKVRVPVPVALDRDEWPDTNGMRHSPQGRRSDERRSYEFGMHDHERAWNFARSRFNRQRINSPWFDAYQRSDIDLSTLRDIVHNPLTHQAEPVLLDSLPNIPSAARFTLYLRNLRQRLYCGAGSWAAPQILFAGVLQEQTLYDLTVEEDHSFVVEGIVAHNCLTNCKCRLRIRMLDPEELDADVYWQLGNAEHCEDCVRLSREWRPLRIRGGEVVR